MRKKTTRLDINERRIIQNFLKMNKSGKEIALALGRATSCICKEVRNNGGTKEYDADKAHQKYIERAFGPRPKRKKIEQIEEVKKIESNNDGEKPKEEIKEEETDNRPFVPDFSGECYVRKHKGKFWFMITSDMFESLLNQCTINKGFTKSN